MKILPTEIYCNQHRHWVPMHEGAKYKKDSQGATRWTCASCAERFTKPKGKKHAEG